MKIFRKKKETDTGKRVSWAQATADRVAPSTIITNGNIIDPEDPKWYEDYKFLTDDKNKSSSRKNIKFGRNRDAIVRYMPGKHLLIKGNTKDALDTNGRQAPLMHRSTEKKTAREMYRDFLKDSEDALKTAGYKGKGEIDKELREAIKKEIRKQHKIHNIKKVSKVVAPILAGSTLLGISVKNKKKEKEN